jgi:hypothetical protein
MTEPVSYRNVHDKLVYEVRFIEGTRRTPGCVELLRKDGKHREAAKMPVEEWRRLLDFGFFTKVS